MTTTMKALNQACIPRPDVLDGTADFLVNRADLASLTEADAHEFLDSNVVMSGIETLPSQSFAPPAGTGSSSGICKLSVSTGGVCRRA